jgi:hypothetical protein
VTAPIVCLGHYEAGLEAVTLALLIRATNLRAVFCGPSVRLHYVPPGSISRRVFKNPQSVFIGGVAAVILELKGSACTHQCGNTLP